MEDNVVVLLDDVGESRCTRGLTFLLLDLRRWIEEHTGQASSNNSVLVFTCYCLIPSYKAFESPLRDLPKFVARITILFLLPVLLGLITL